MNRAARDELDSDFGLGRRVFAGRRTRRLATGNGGRASVHARLGSGTDLRASGIALYRIFDGASAGRRDVQVRADAALYIDLSRAFGFVIVAALTRNASDDANYDYTKVEVYVGGVAVTSAH